MAVPQVAERVPLRLLIIEDSEDDALLLLHRFRGAGYDCTHMRVDSEFGMRDALANGTWDAVLCDHRMPNFSAIAALEVLQASGHDLPFVIVSGFIDEETAIAAMRAGAHDYLGKDKLHRLVPAVEREIREARHREERRVALEAVKENEERFRTLAANIPGMAFQMTRDENGVLAFPYVSEGASAVLGMRPSELGARPERFREMIRAEDREAFEAALLVSAKGFSTVNWEGRIMTPSSEMKWVNLRSSPRRTDGGLVWEGVVFNITQSKEAERELRESRAQLAELSAHLQAIKEEERERIARDIHDELGGNLVAVKFEVAMLGSKIPSDQELLRKRVQSVEKLVDEAIATAGRVARELRPGILKEFGLAAAIESHAQDFTQRTSIPCQIVCPDHDIQPDSDTSTALFRIFQEALTNVSKHANASDVEVLLLQEGDDICLEIRDDGCGIRSSDFTKPRSFGLRGIRERINALRGTLEVSAAEPRGTRISVRAPMSRNREGLDPACAEGRT